MTSLRKSLALATSLALLAAVAGLALAGGTTAAVVIHNPTGNTIRYQLKTGDGDWQSKSLPPHTKVAHHLLLTGHDSPPTYYVRFDWIAGDGQVTYKSYKLTPYTVSDSRNGRA